MADSLYLTSMELFSNEFFINDRLTEEVHKMAFFISVWHAPNFLKCSLAATAPANDLALLYVMLHLSKVEDNDFLRIESKFSESIQRHISYCKAPQAIIRLFDEKAE